MRKLLLSLLLVLLLATGSSAANYYFDLASGNDTTGDGTYGNPWKTIDKCTTSRTGGDECRGAKTTITTLSGTLTFTNGSTSVSTSSDLTAVVAANDLVGKNSGLEGWFKVSSVSASAITLVVEYWGLSGSGSAVTGYKVTPVAASEEYDISVSGSSESSLLKISGGWDLSTQTQDGWTCFSTTYANSIDFNTRRYIELSKFIVSATSSHALNLGTTAGYKYVHDMHLIGGTSSHINFASVLQFNIYLENITGTGITATSFNGMSISSTYGYFKSIYFYSGGTSGSGAAFVVGGATNVFDDIRAYNHYNAGIALSTESSGNYFNSCIVEEVQNASAGPCIQISNEPSHNNYFTDFTGSGCVYGVYFNLGCSLNTSFISSTITATSSLYQNAGSCQGVKDPLLIYKTAGSDSRMIFGDGEITHDSSASCRSGKCLKYDPSNVSFTLSYKVGTVKIPSAGSDLTLSAYIKDDASFDGRVFFIAVRDGKFISRTEKTPTTSFVQESVVVPAASLVADEYLDLIIAVNGTAGLLWVDDFSASQ